MADVSQRQRYRPSGGVKWSVFLPYAAGALLVALGFAVGLNAMFMRGWYVLFLMPFVCGGLLSVFVAMAITRGRCRFRCWVGCLG